MTGYPQNADLIGGHVAVDLVNTVSWRLDPARRVDRLADSATLTRWATHAGVLDLAGSQLVAAAGSAHPDAAADGLHAVRDLREALHGVLTAVTDGHAPDEDALATLHGAVAEAVSRAPFAPGLPLIWSVTARVPRDIARLVALESLDLLRDGDRLAALRRCRGMYCGWFFIDKSRSHTRRWCSSDDCGNRERVRRHYARTRSGGQPPKSDAAPAPQPRRRD